MFIFPTKKNGPPYIRAKTPRSTDLMRAATCVKKTHPAMPQGHKKIFAESRFFPRSTDPRAQNR